MNQLLEQIRFQFTESIQTKINSADLISNAIAEAGEEIVQRLLDGKKILSCGYNGGTHISAQFTTKMLHRFKEERPGLPAINLNTNLIYSYDYHIPHDLFSRGIRALGQAGDILFLISGFSDSVCLQHAIKSAHDKNMLAIALTSEEEANISATLSETDIEIRIPSKDTARIEEMHLLIVHCICSIIDFRLFGHGD